MKLDMNAFFGHWPYYPLPHTEAEDALRLMDRFGIDQAAICSLRGLHGDWHEANAETLAFARAHADRLTPIASMSPVDGGGGEPLRGLVNEGFRGLRLYPLMLQGYDLTGRFAQEVAAVAGEMKVPLIIPTRPMMNFRFTTLAIGTIEALARTFPNTSVILSGPNYLTEFRAAIEALQRTENLFMEISCMQGLHAVQGLVEAVGADRVIFGTGLPLHYPACGVAKLNHARISDDHRAAVASGNALRLLGLQ